MKIGFVHSKRDRGGPFVPTDPIIFGPFVPVETAPEFCPKIYFEYPIKRPVTAVVWEAPTLKGHYISMQLFNWTRLETLGTIEEAGGERDGFIPISFN